MLFRALSWIDLPAAGFPHSYLSTVPICFAHGLAVVQNPIVRSAVVGRLSTPTTAAGWRGGCRHGIWHTLAGEAIADLTRIARHILRNTDAATTSVISVRIWIAPSALRKLNVIGVLNSSA